MTLTTEQIQAVQAGQAVPLSPPEVGAECVLIRRDLYERVSRLISDDKEFDPRDAYSLINQVMADDDRNDPWLDSYQQP